MGKRDVVITEAESTLGEKAVEEALELLKAKHDAYKSEQYCHYVVKGEYEEECDSEEYCGECIDDAVSLFAQRYKNRRIHELNRVRDLKRWGCCYSFGWYGDDYEAKTLRRHVLPDHLTIEDYEQKIYEKYPDNVPFSYRYYQLGSETSCRTCHNCGIIIDSCVTVDEQEVDHWEDNMDLTEFNVTTMDEYMAHQLYEILQFTHQVDSWLRPRVWAIANNIIKATG